MAEDLNSGRFVFRVGGVIRAYGDWRLCPAVFDELITFAPDIPPPPHTPEQHDEIAVWENRLAELLRRNNASRK
jgi:hypothetical protein